MKAAIITQARTGSTRLPNKIFKEADNRPLLWYHINRLNQSGIPVIVATSVLKQDDVIEDFCRRNNTLFFRGSENNVLERFYQSAVENKLDVIIRVCSDAPLIDGDVIKQGLDSYQAVENRQLYTSNCITRTFPYGFEFEIFSMEMLKEAFERSSNNYQKEHVTPYIQDNESGNIIFKNLEYAKDKSNYRLTLDTPEDYELIRILIEEYNADQLSCAEIISLLDKHPELVSMNAHIKQKKA